MKCKPSANPVYSDSLKVSKKVGDIFREVGGFSEILEISLRVLEGFQSVSEDVLVLEVVPQQCEQVAYSGDTRSLGC